MSRLSPLRHQLSWLRRRRHSVRLAAAWFAIALAVLCGLGAMFLLDWQLSMNRAQRIVALAIGARAVIWAYRRFARPLLAVNETDLDMALMVERQQGIDSDLVAAIQFESPEAARWGSVALERAVIDYVASFSSGTNVLEGIPTEHIYRRGLALAATVALFCMAVALFPQYAATFFARLAMSNAHYPTRTVIDEVHVNGAAVTPDVRVVRAGYGEPINFAVRISGEMPGDLKRVDLRSAAGGVAQPVELTEAAKLPGGAMVFKGQLPQLVDSLEFEVHLGDAWTEATRLEAIPLPVVELMLTATPPAYARSAALAEPEQTAGSHQLSVLEGSRADLEITCENKPLSAAMLTMDKKDFPLEKTAADGRRWTLAGKESPLSRIDSPTRFEIQVTDADGLRLPRPVEGYIRIKPDRPPTVNASVDVQYFLPNTGLPEINYSANDDYGISRIQLYVEVIHPGGTSESPAEPIAISKENLAKPLLKPNLPLAGAYRLPLDQFKLAKGDQVKLTLEATDFRGDQPGKSTKSDPVVLQITDEGGIMAALSETDRHAYEQMNTLIQRQSQTGGLK
ncbi:MAG TPA: DUF4175 family protein [Pirellulales bacterium]|nr:DUF4175 family protein [Pirellulales bacterium]